MHSPAAAHRKCNQRSLFCLFRPTCVTLHSQSPPDACKDRITTKTQTAGRTKTSLPRSTRIARAHATCVYWKSDRALQQGRKKQVGKTTWGKNSLYYQGWGSATSTFLIQYSFRAISILANTGGVSSVGTLHPNITPHWQDIILRSSWGKEGNISA